ncbi:MAG: sortase [Clostridia bacterium]|nr:sortase [Clostridia bacterium]
MFESKYSKILTVILVIVVMAIVGLLGYLGYDYYKKYIVNSEAEDFVNNFTADATEEQNIEEGNEESSGSWDDLNIADENLNSQNNGDSKKPTYNGFVTLGTIYIPATECKYPILEKMTTTSLENGVVFVWGAGINKAGNTVIAGHNYRNGQFFSNNKKLNIGDKIKITDNDKKTLTYTIYNKFETTDNDTSFYQRDTGGKPEISLSTCTDNGKGRLIILANIQ